MSILDKISLPADLRRLPETQLPQLAGELRREVIECISRTGGHLGAGLGVVELTVALHYIFNTPEDKIVWDVGHQTYPHKILTGRRARMDSLRKEGGLCGFTSRAESEYDAFGAGHSSTSISAAIGMATARDITGGRNEVIAVIGDGAMSAGLAYEALNNASACKRLIVILNDNEMSIAPPVGAMSAYLSNLISSRPYMAVRNKAKQVASHLPKIAQEAARKTEQYAKHVSSGGGGNLFEAMGFYYIGPVDGHNISHLLPVLRNLKERPWDEGDNDKPVLLHVVTQKGKGFESPEVSNEKFHAVGRFDVKTGAQEKGKSQRAPSYTSVFADTLTQIAYKDKRVTAITAAMPSGTGVDKFAAAHPERAFDVGIAEQHAVTFAAGQAAGDVPLKPFVAIYSTFLQRGYDQLVHDVAVQNLPVRFMIDRAGIVGGDGATHNGAFDIAYLTPLPNMIVMAPADEAELARMVVTAHSINDAPSAVRYPRGEGTGAQVPPLEDISKLEIGRARIIREADGSHISAIYNAMNKTLASKAEPAPMVEEIISVAGNYERQYGRRRDDIVRELSANAKKDDGVKIAIISLGTRLAEAQKAADILSKEGGCSATVIDARFAKPIDENMLHAASLSHNIIITVEEGAAGGFGAMVGQYLSSRDLLGQVFLRTLTLPDHFIEHGDTYDIYESAGLNASGIVRAATELSALFADEG